MKKILFAPAAYNLAEVTRAIEVAKACRDKFELLFYHHGGRYGRFIQEEGFEVREIEPRLTEEKIEHLYRIDRGDEFGDFFTQEELDRRIESEVAFLNSIKPSAVVTGFNLTLPISAKVAKTPLVWLIGTPWISQYFQAGLGTWPDMLDYAFLRWVPDGLLNWLANKTMPALMGMFLSSFNKAAKRFGVRPFRGTEFWEGDYGLLAEPPELSGLQVLPSKFHYIGPLIARLNVPIPEEVANIGRDKPIVFFAMGSSGRPDLVAEIISGFGGKDYRVIAPVKGLIDKMSLTVPENVIVTDLLPAHKVNPLADISVVHGGIGTVMTACLAGKPIVGVGMQIEQEANLENLVRKGFAVRIRKKRLSAEAVLKAIDRLLGDEEALGKAQEFKKVVESWDGPSNAAKFLLEVFDNQ